MSRPARSLVGGRALVTGASSGIGAATARLLDARGVRVALSGRCSAGLATTADRMHGPVCIPGDLTVPGEAASVVAKAAAALGGLDIVVSNAGAGWAGPFETMTANDIDAMLDVNLRAGIHVIHAALPHLLDEGAGHLVLVGSIAGLLPVGGEAVYSAAKAATSALAEALRSELTTRGISVCLVTPGVVDTPFFDRRNRPYERTRPRPIPAGVVADAIVDSLEQGRAGCIVPRWMGLPVRLRGGSPRLYRLLADRFS